MVFQKSVQKYKLYCLVPKNFLPLNVLNVYKSNKRVYLSINNLKL